MPYCILEAFLSISKIIFFYSTGGGRAARLDEVCSQELCQQGCRAACHFYRLLLSGNRADAKQNGGHAAEGEADARQTESSRPTGFFLLSGNRAVSHADSLQAGRLELSAEGNRADATMKLLLSNCRLSWSSAEKGSVYVLLGKDRYLLFIVHHKVH